jgi:hypothetical protein
MEAHGIAKNPIFKKILSIGYELETSSISKLTKISIEDDVLMNTDTAGPDLKKIADNAEDEEYALRQEELIELPLYTTESLDNNSPEKIENATFLSSNDISITPFTKQLKTYCHDDEAEDEDDIFDKDELYKLHIQHGDTYRINFENWSDRDCGMFADVEWIVTYFNPESSDNIIVDTFVNTIKNLLKHLDKLEVHKGILSINFSETDKENIKTPEVRTVFKLPDTNMYYMQILFLDQLLKVDDICISPQMTFSCKAYDLINIFKAVLNYQGFSSRNFKQFKVKMDKLLSIIKNLEVCIDHLIDDYNSQQPDEKKIIENRNEDIVKSIKAYLLMILYKLDLYINSYTQYLETEKGKKKVPYFKDFLFFNSRHLNYDFYKEIKSCLLELFGNRFKEIEIIDIIHKLILNNKILRKYLSKDVKIAQLPKTDENYGNPKYSLSSYFNFFEDPIDSADNRNSDNEIGHDWFRYKALDVFSTTMDIKDRVILTEIRAFRHMLAAYMSEIATKKLIHEMTNGTCNVSKGYSSPDSGYITINAFRQFMAIHDKQKNYIESQVAGKKTRTTRLVNRKTRNKKNCK